MQTMWQTIVAWFDATALNAGAREPRAQRTEPARWVPYIVLHAGCLGVLWVGWSWVAVGVAVVLYVVRMFGITGFYHRYFSHRAFRTSRFMQFVFGVWANSAAQRGPIWWASQHRQHHAHSDEEVDAHSPRQHGFYWSHIGWLTARDNLAINERYVKDLLKYPELRFLDRFDTVVPILLAAGLFVLGWGLSVFAPQLGTNGLQMLVWGFFISTVVLFHATCTINSLSHIFGSRRYATKDDSRNNVWLALLTMGEGWHNNHHRFPAAARQGFFWWEIDLTYYGLKVLAALGLIWDLKPVPARVLGETPVDETKRAA
jgi:stearoyl-CoA desaturase (delta-9 desaturase)